jgi:membrane protease YdiL (CAAX protease family)
MQQPFEFSNISCIQSASFLILKTDNHEKVSAVSTLSNQEDLEKSSNYKQPVRFLSDKPLRLAGSFFLLALIFRVVDIFILEMNTTDFGILPSKIFPLLLIVLYLRKSGWSVSNIGLRSSNLGNNAILGFLAFIVFDGTLTGGSYLLLFILRMSPIVSIYKLDYLAFDLTFQIANAFMEEMLFRGLILICFMSVMSPIKANILQGFLFGLWHLVWPIDAYLGGLIGTAGAISWSVEYVLSSMLIGLLFGYLYQKTKSLVGPILFHFFVDLTSAYISIEPSLAVIQLGLGGLALLVTFIVMYYFIRKHRIIRSSFGEAHD